MKKRIHFLLLAVAMALSLVPMMAFTAFAEDTHSHPICGTDCNGVHGAETDTGDTHKPVEWTPLSSVLTYDDAADTWSGTLDASGSYYLAEDMMTSETITISGAVDLCLNDHVLQYSGKNSTNPLFRISVGGTLNLCDCNSDNQSHSFAVDDTGLWSLDVTGTESVTGGVIIGGISGGVIVRGTFNMYGGNIVGCSEGGVFVATDAFFTMNDGNISGNAYDYRGGGVSVFAGGSFTMNGGTIRRNTVFGALDSWGGGVYASGTVGGGTTELATFTMNGGTISDNVGTGNTGYGGGVAAVHCTFTMTGGIISNNTAPLNGGGVLSNGEGSFTMTGGTISNNTATLNGGGVWVGSSFTMTGGTISENTAAGNLGGGGVFVGANTYFGVSGSPVISGNCKSDGTTDNVFLYDVTYSTPIDRYLTVEGPLAGDSLIGVTLNTSDGTGRFAKPSGEEITDLTEYEDFFFSDKGLAVKPVTEGTGISLELLQGYNVTVNDASYGTVKAPTPIAYVGKNVTLTVTPETGYTVDTVTVKDDDGKDVEVKDDYTFTMPASNVTVSATFSLIDYSVTLSGDTDYITNSGQFPQTANYQDEITLTVAGVPSGYAMTFDVTDAKGKAVDVTSPKDSVDGDYRFIMPASAVTINAAAKVLVDKDGDGEADEYVDPDEVIDGVYEDEDGYYKDVSDPEDGILDPVVPVDKDGDGAADKYIDPDEVIDGIYEDEDGYYKDVSDPEDGILDPAIPVDKDGDGEADEYVDAKEVIDGVYTDEDGYYKDVSDPEDGILDPVVPVDKDGDGEADKYVDPDEVNEDGIYEDEDGYYKDVSDPEDGILDPVIPVDKDGDGEADEYVDAKEVIDGVYTDEDGYYKDVSDPEDGILDPGSPLTRTAMVMRISTLILTK